MATFSVVVFSVLVMCFVGVAQGWEWQSALKVLEDGRGGQTVQQRVEELLRKRMKATTPFSWSSCGGSTDLGVINKLSLGPSPIQVPGVVNVSFTGSLKQDIKSPIKVELEVYKKVLVWIKVPCLDEMGSCTYDDLCALLVHIQCPAAFRKHNIPCDCPLKASSYSLPPSQVHVHPFKVPEFLKEGDYKVHVKVSASGKQVVCLDFQFSMK